MRRTFAAVVMVVLVVSGSSYSRSKVGEMFGHDVFWLEPGMRLDTLDWHQFETTKFETDSSERRVPEDAVEQFAAAELALYYLDGLTGITAAILLDRGYSVAFLSQWNAVPSQYIMTNAKGTTNADYERRRIVSDHMWEVLEGADVTKPSKLGGGYTVKLRLAHAGYSIVEGNQELGKGTLDMVTLSDGVILSFYGGTDQDLSFSRRIYRTVLVAPKGTKPSRIVSEIESTMDKLKLDLSYTVPKVKPVK